MNDMTYLISIPHPVTGMTSPQRAVNGVVKRRIPLSVSHPTQRSIDTLHGARNTCKSNTALCGRCRIQLSTAYTKARGLKLAPPSGGLLRCCSYHRHLLLTRHKTVKGVVTSLGCMANTPRVRGPDGRIRCLSGWKDGRIKFHWVER